MEASPASGSQRISRLMQDPSYKKWYESMTIAKNTLWTYSYGLELYSQFSGMSLSELVEEARTDYINKVAPWESKHINRFKEFVAYLKGMDGKLANGTKLLHAKGVRNFYSFHLGVPFNIKIGIQQGATDEYLDLPVPKIEDVRKAVLNCGTDKMLKAMILTIFSSGQGQAEIRILKGKHLKEIVNGIAIVHMTREKMSGQTVKRRYTFFIGSEALAAIKEYKPNLKDEDYVFTQRGSDKPLSAQEVDRWFAIHAEKCGFDRAYFAPHRLGRHYFKTTLEGNMTHSFIEFIMGHKLPGAESHYLLYKDKMLEEYVKCQHLLTIYTPQEKLQADYDKLKQSSGSVELLKNQMSERDSHIEILEKKVDALLEYIEMIRPAAKAPERLIQLQNEMLSSK